MSFFEIISIIWFMSQDRSPFVLSPPSSQKIRGTKKVRQTLCENQLCQPIVITICISKVVQHTNDKCSKERLEAN